MGKDLTNQSLFGHNGNVEPETMIRGAEWLICAPVVLRTAPFWSFSTVWTGSEECSMLLSENYGSYPKAGTTLLGEKTGFDKPSLSTKFCHAEKTAF